MVNSPGNPVPGCGVIPGRDSIINGYGAYLDCKKRMMGGYRVVERMNVGTVEVR